MSLTQNYLWELWGPGVTNEYETRRDIVDKSAQHPHALRYADWNHARCVFDRILVVVDPAARTHPALEKAARLAANCGGSLELCLFDEAQSPPESWAGGSRGNEYRELMRRRYLEELELLASPLRSRGIAVTTVSEWHAPHYEGIGHHVIRTMPDLVVKETHPLGAVPSAFSRSDWLLIRNLPVPLLLVHGDTWPDQLHVGVAIDPFHPAHRPVALDDELLSIAQSLRDALKSELVVVHVLQSPRHLPGESVSAQTKTQLHAAAHKVVEHMAATVALPVVFAEGRVRDALCAYAQQSRPHILILGAAARPRWAHTAASGTAAHILENVGCDVLVVKPPGFVSPLLVTDD